MSELNYTPVKGESSVDRFKRIQKQLQSHKPKGNGFTNLFQIQRKHSAMTGSHFEIATNEDGRMKMIWRFHSFATIEIPGGKTTFHQGKNFVHLIYWN